MTQRNIIYILYIIYINIYVYIYFIQKLPFEYTDTYTYIYMWIYRERLISAENNIGEGMCQRKKKEQKNERFCLSCVLCIYRREGRFKRGISADKRTGPVLLATVSFMCLCCFRGQRANTPYHEL